MKSDLQISLQIKKHRSITERGLSAQRKNTTECQAFYAGDFMNYKDTVQFSDPLGRKKKAMVQFNEVKPYVNSVKGFMAQNRRKAKYTARIEEEIPRTLYSRYSNSLADYVRENANADQIETLMDGEMLINGYAAVETNMSYGDGYSSRDPNGEILMMNLDPVCVGWDPYAKRTNLLDARWCYYDQVYGLDEALALFDKAKEEDFDTADGENNSGFNYNAGGGVYDKVKEGLDWSDEESQMVRVCFYQWYEIETFYRAANPIYSLKNPQAIEAAALALESMVEEANEDSDGLFEFDPRAEILTFNADTKAKLVETFGDFIKVYDYKRKVFYTAVSSGEKVFNKYKNICQQGFTIKFKTGDYDSKNKIWTGMVNSMKEPVLYYNKALTELMFIIGANSKGGVLVETGAVQDITDFEQKYAKTDAVIQVNDGGLEKIRDKKTPFAPTGYEEIITLSAAAISSVNGIDKTFLGSSENRQETAALQRQRIKQVVSSLACYFDAITLYQKEHARMLIDLLRVFVENNDGSLIQVLGENGKEEFMRLSSDKFVNEYQVSIQEAPQTQDEKVEFSTTLTAMGDRLVAVGDPAAKQIYAIAVKYLPLDPEDKQKLMEVLNPQQQAVDPAYVQQLEEQLKAVMSELTQAQLEEIKSKIALNSAKVDETMAKVNKTAADTVKSIEEAEQISIENKILPQQGQDNVNVSI